VVVVVVVVLLLVGSELGRRATQCERRELLSRRRRRFSLQTVVCGLWALAERPTTRDSRRLATRWGGAQENKRHLLCLCLLFVVVVCVRPNEWEPSGNNN